MLGNAEREVDEAESAVVEASTKLKQLSTNERKSQLERARHKLNDRQRNLAWQHRKQDELDNNGTALLEKGLEPHELSEQERRWNSEIQPGAASSWVFTAAAAGATTTATAGAHAAASTGPAAEVPNAPVAASALPAALITIDHEPDAPIPDAFATPQAAATGEAAAATTATAGAQAAASGGPAAEVPDAPVAASVLPAALITIDQGPEAPVPDAVVTPQAAATGEAAMEVDASLSEKGAPPWATPLSRTLPPPQPYLRLLTSSRHRTLDVSRVDFP